MCGIAGIVKLDPRRNVEASRLDRMVDAMHHRGPDGRGTLLDGPVGLGHARLAIVDLAGGAQPIANETTTAWIVCNGEIYNHPDLSRQLEGQGHRYRTASDSETALHAYEDGGPDCVERLHGMFAFAVWDRARRRLLLVRDRLGIKPLYYACTGDELVFASEIKAILASGAVRPELDRGALPELLANRFVAGSGTLFRGVHQLRPGRWLSFSFDEGLRIRRYWTPPEPIEDLAPSPALQTEEIRWRLAQAVKSHLMSDVPVGLFLSGGIDSSGLAALMAPLMREPVRTFAVGFPEAQANELDYARLVARRIGAEHREVVITADQFFGELGRMIWQEDEPIAFPASVPLYFLSRLAADHVKVVLTGEGADELFLGYNRYRVTAWNAALDRFPGNLVGPGARARLRALLARLPGRLGRAATRTFLALPSGPRGLYCENFAVFSHELRRELFDRATERNDPHAESLRCYEAGRGGALDRMCRADLQTYLVRLLGKQDRMSMAASIESRVPFLDDRLVEHVLGIPGRFKLRGLKTKVLLRRSLADLVPPQILTRRKMGFPVPVGDWLRRSYTALLDDLVLGPRARARGLWDSRSVERLVGEHRAGAANHADRLWLLLNLEIWQRIFLDGEAAATLPVAQPCS
jgi:asparagine synthase (glutamine-hydrolysing)